MCYLSSSVGRALSLQSRVGREGGGREERGGEGGGGRGEGKGDVTSTFVSLLIYA